MSTKFAVEGLTESMLYEVEPFGIKVILIEPGAIKTNFFNSSVLAKKSQDPNSPYAPLMTGMKNSIDKVMENASTPQYVAEVVFDAVTNENPKLRYLAGKDVEQWVDAKKKMSDEDFVNMMKQM